MGAARGRSVRDLDGPFPGHHVADLWSPARALADGLERPARRPTSHPGGLASQASIRGMRLWWSAWRALRAWRSRRSSRAAVAWAGSVRSCAMSSGCGPGRAGGRHGWVLARPAAWRWRGPRRSVRQPAPGRLEPRTGGRVCRATPTGRAGSPRAPARATPAPAQSTTTIRTNGARPHRPPAHAEGPPYAGASATGRTGSPRAPARATPAPAQSSTTIRTNAAHPHRPQRTLKVPHSLVRHRQVALVVRALRLPRRQRLRNRQRRFVRTPRTRTVPQRTLKVPHLLCDTDRSRW